MEPEEFLSEGTVRVREDSFAVIKATEPDPEAFATVSDGTETTVIAADGEYNEDHVIELEKGWRLLTFEMVLPFELVGFLAEVATILAEEGISIMAVSAFSTDHILVKSDDLEAAIAQLSELGCDIQRGP